ncbi:hypothetical protein BKX93_01490 [Chromobacterium vaccinii]|uniref:Morphogenetic protein n=2 Tax=Chromobacterium vaccinii TaxID=1108595 RepID=A0A1D9LN02_9NEIS|nr:hypothetical protein BKX93_01490 [Chromobacterium vaccinii]
MPNVNEKPILFCAEMVRALLAGTKTQTRRVAKPVKHPDFGNLYEPGAMVLEREPQHVINRACPYGQPGDRLWVRETWGVISHSWDKAGNMVDWVPDRPATPILELPFGRVYYSGHVIYAADGYMEWAGDDDGGGEPRSAWKPSIHMPRTASRILLEITDVRVEQLQDISEADAVAEGCVAEPCDHSRQSCEDIGCYGPTAAGAYHWLWNRLNGAGSWDANPWVWVIEFKRVEK